MSVRKMLFLVAILFLLISLAYKAAQILYRNSLPEEDLG
jgi:hypothetical protein